MALRMERRGTWETDRASGRMVRVVEGDATPLPPQPPPAMVAIVCPICLPDRRVLGHAAPVAGAIYEAKCRHCKAVVRVAF